MRRVLHLTAYAVSCFLLNNVLQAHYYGACRSSVFALFTLGQSGYCHFIDSCLKVLQWSPVLVAAPMLLEDHWRNRHHDGAAPES
jgi:hypothetical protein